MEDSILEARQCYENGGFGIRGKAILVTGMEDSVLEARQGPLTLLFRVEGLHIEIVRFAGSSWKGVRFAGSSWRGAKINLLECCREDEETREDADIPPVDGRGRWTGVVGGAKSPTLSARNHIKPEYHKLYFITSIKKRYPTLRSQNNKSEQLADIIHSLIVFPLMNVFIYSDLDKSWPICYVISRGKSVKSYPGRCMYPPTRTMFPRSWRPFCTKSMSKEGLNPWAKREWLSKEGLNPWAKREWLSKEGLNPWAKRD